MCKAGGLHRFGIKSSEGDGILRLGRDEMFRDPAADLSDFKTVG